MRIHTCVCSAVSWCALQKFRRIVVGHFNDDSHAKIAPFHGLAEKLRDTCHFVLRKSSPHVGEDGSKVHLFALHGTCFTFGVTLHKCIKPIFFRKILETEGINAFIQYYTNSSGKLIPSTSVSHHLFFVC